MGLGHYKIPELQPNIPHHLALQ